MTQCRLGVKIPEFSNEPAYGNQATEDQNLLCELPPA